MRGQNTIIRMRLHNLKPRDVLVLVLDGPCSRNFYHDAENIVANGGQPEVHIAADEIPGTLDLRFLTGLTILLQGSNVPRMRQVFARLKDFDVERIVTSTGDFIHDYRRAA